MDEDVQPVKGDTEQIEDAFTESASTATHISRLITPRSIVKSFVISIKANNIDNPAKFLIVDGAGTGMEIGSDFAEGLYGNQHLTMHYGFVDHTTYFTITILSSFWLWCSAGACSRGAVPFQIPFATFKFSLGFDGAITIQDHIVLLQY